MQEKNNICNIANPYCQVKLDYKDGDLLKVKLVWDSYNSLDLCAFFLAKDGTVGGVFPSEYKARREASGSLTIINHLNINNYARNYIEKEDHSS